MISALQINTVSKGLIIAVTQCYLEQGLFDFVFAVKNINTGTDNHRYADPFGERRKITKYPIPQHGHGNYFQILKWCKNRGLRFGESNNDEQMTEGADRDYRY